ncbi:oligosaccharide flippase family protein [Sphingomonas sp. R86520]|uniref:oligosaccharide flippase family protein n=1 Tax=Sphingomonas sp. R86520 TaxID=3093859 RepID=UPI0036D29FFB
MIGRKARSAGVLAIGRASEVAFPLLRAILLTRLLPKDQFGLAITLSVMAALVELSTDIGLDRYAIVRKIPDSELGRGTMHALSVLRGAIIGLFLCAIGPLVARAFDSPGQWWAFSLLGLASFIRGFMNLGIKEAMRDYRFWPEGVTVATSQIVWTIVSVGLAFAWHDYRCMIAGLLGAQVAFVLVSHTTVRTRWRLAWSPDEARTILQFSLPLVPNGISLACRHMADRLIVGAFMSLGVAAVYNVNMMVALMPRSMIQSFVTSVTLPVFANHESGRRPVANLYRGWAIALAAIAAIYGLGVLCFGQPVTSLVFGSDFAIDQSFFALAAILVAIKILYGLPVPPALAVGDTGFILFGTAAALGSPVLGMISAWLNPSLDPFVAAMCVGEFVGLVWIGWRCMRRFGFTATDVWTALLVPLVAIAGTGAVLATTSGSWSARISMFVGASSLCLAGVYFALARAGIDWRILMRRKDTPSSRLVAESL